MDPLTPQIWYTYRTEMLLNLISRSVRCKDSIWGLVKGKFCRIHISIAWCLASFDPSARGFLQETRRLPYFIHLHGTCSTVSCLELTPADCGICLVFMSPPVRNRHNSFNLMRTFLGSISWLGETSSAYLSSLKIFHRSFRMDKVSKLTLIEPIFSHLRKEVYTPGLAQIIFAFFNYALSRLVIPPSISSWCFNNWKMVERSIVGALLVQKWLARDQFLRSTNGKLCNLFNCLLPLVQTIVFEFCRTSTGILGPNWKSVGKSRLFALWDRDVRK